MRSARRGRKHHTHRHYQRTDWMGYPIETHKKRKHHKKSHKKRRYARYRTRTPHQYKKTTGWLENTRKRIQDVIGKKNNKSKKINRTEKEWKDTYRKRYREKYYEEHARMPSESEMNEWEEDYEIAIAEQKNMD